MTKAKTKTGNNKKTTLPPVAGAGDDLGLGDGLGIASDDELGAVLGDEKSPEELAADKAFDEEVAKGVQAEKDEFDKAVAEQVEKEVAAMRKDEPKHKPVVDVDLSAGSKEGKIAITHFSVISRSKNFTYLKLNLETGRKHQIRVHCKDAGHPILGDKRYSPTLSPISRMCLHSCLLEFLHPILIFCWLRPVCKLLI